MAVAMDALGALLAPMGRIVRVRTVPKGTSRGRLYHLSRGYMVSLAGARLVFLRRKADAVWFSVDAGKGMLYVIALTWIALRLGYRVVLQHHSYAYISRRSRLAAVLVYVGGSRADHLHSCQLACSDFRRLYPRAASVRALSVAYGLNLPPNERRQTNPFGSRRLRVGHLSNLTVEKGLEEVIRFGRAGLRQGKLETVILAGPVTGSVERALLDEVAREPGFEYRGSVTGKRKEQFFRDIDLFLFPSRYRNESYGLVAWEAMLRGVPLIAYRAGCLTQDAVGTGNLVLETVDDFTANALRRIELWSESPVEFLRASAAAAEAARQERESAISDVLLLGHDLFDPPLRGA
jgi:glycosyltransferase involved in cell wall biosynthesis